MPKEDKRWRPAPPVKEIFRISGIVRTRNITQSSIVKNNGYTTVLAAVMFAF